MPLRGSPRDKVRQVMHEWKEGKLRSGSKRGPRVRSQRQAIAIALNQAGLSRGSRRGRRKSTRR